MATKPYVRILFASCLVVFILNKFAIRPWIVANHDSGVLLSISYSLPNFIEAIMGTVLISGVFCFFRQRPTKLRHRPTDSTIYLMATLIAGTYVLAQEFKLHSVGGNNVYDFNDVLASILGLVVVYLMLTRFGFIAHPK
jgi:hypothetical protein